GRRGGGRPDPRGAQAQRRALRVALDLRAGGPCHLLPDVGHRLDDVRDQALGVLPRAAGGTRLRRRRGELLRRVRRERLLVSRPVGETFAMTRRQLLKAAAAAAAAWRLAPWPVRAPAALAQGPPGDRSLPPTLQAFSDPLIPGAKR